MHDRASEVGRERKREGGREREKEGGRDEERSNIDKTSIIARFVHVHAHQLEHTFMSIVRSDMYVHA